MFLDLNVPALTQWVARRGLFNGLYTNLLFIPGGKSGLFVSGVSGLGEEEILCFLVMW